MSDSPQPAQPGDNELDKLAAYEAELAQVEDKLDKIKVAKSGISIMYEGKTDALRELIEEFERRKAAIEREVWDFGDGLRKAKAREAELLREKEEIAKKKQDYLNFLKANSANAVLNERWQRMLAGAPWREFALDHQFDAAKQFAQQKILFLADEMGLGKTLSAIMSLDFIRAATENASPDNPYEPDIEDFWNPETGQMDKRFVNGVTRPAGIRTLYIAPSGLQRNVYDEFKHWAPHRNVVPLGNIPQYQRQFAMSIASEQDNFVALINYESWRKDPDLLNQLGALEFDSLIVDEWHNAKEITTDTWQGIKKIYTDSYIPFFMPMTGTPILNSPEDLYSFLHLYDPATFYSKTAYLRQYCRMNENERWEFKDGGVEAIRNILGHHYLRRTKETAGIKIPPLTPKVHLLEIDEEKYPEQARARKSMRANAAVLLKSTDEFGDPKAIAAGGQLAVYTRLRQIEVWPNGIVLKDERGNEVERLDVYESQKLDYIAEPDGSNGLAFELIEESRVVVFSQFVDPLVELAKRLRKGGKNPALIHGAVKLDERNRISRDFDVKFRSDPDHGKHEIVLCQYKTGGVGINLTEANQMIIIDEEWNPGKRDQAYGRIARMGQERDMIVHRIHMMNTIDDWLAGIMEQKENLVEGFDSKMAITKDDLLNALESGLI